MRRWFMLISALLIISSGTVAQSAQSSWPPTLVWSASSFECPAVDTKRKIEDAALDGDAGAQTQFGKAQVHSCPGWKNPVESLQFLNLAAKKTTSKHKSPWETFSATGTRYPRTFFRPPNRLLAQRPRRRARPE